jgi:hypothetical protein
VAQRSIEVLIGRLVTDEAFRDAFLAHRVFALHAFIDTGHELTSVEISAIQATPVTLWQIVANQVDPRLQRAKLSEEPNAGHLNPMTVTREADVD